MGSNYINRVVAGMIFFFLSNLKKMFVFMSLTHQLRCGASPAPIDSRCGGSARQVIPFSKLQRLNCILLLSTSHPPLPRKISHAPSAPALFLRIRNRITLFLRFFCSFVHGFEHQTREVCLV